MFRCHDKLDQDLVYFKATGAIELRLFFTSKSVTTETTQISTTAAYYDPTDLDESET